MLSILVSASLLLLELLLVFDAGILIVVLIEVFPCPGLILALLDVDDGRFLPDRYVEGTCPHCDYEKARGDQCDNCGRLLDPVDLKNPYSAVSGGTNIEIRDTAHLFLLQSKMQDTIREWVEASKDWPQLARSIALKW